MALTCPAEVDLTRLRNSVHLIYARVALDPASAFPFHCGADYAVRWLGYDETSLGMLPVDAAACFTGVGNPHAIGALQPGETVADLGCGSGTDVLLAAQAVGAGGHVVGIDVNESMRARAERGVERARAANVQIRFGDLMDLPLAASSIDVVQVNGALALVPDKPRAIAEMARVLKPGGRLHLADVSVDRELPEALRRDVDLWAAGIGGALTAPELEHALTDAGFKKVRVTARFDCFSGTLHEDLALRHDVYGASVFAVRR